MEPSAFTLTRPERGTTSVLFASPHSGRHYPADFLNRSILDRREIRTSEDAYVDELIAAAPKLGAPLLAAMMPRAFLDLNRSAEELDPGVVAGLRRVTHNPRISSGLGVIPRVVANGRAIYRGKLSLGEAQERLDQFWHPYHRQLRTLLSETHEVFGQAVLVDVHSMPHEALEGLHHRGGKAPDVVLGDRFGAAAAPHIMDFIEAAFASAGLRVARNAPFAGAYIAQTYGRPRHNQHVVQVEIDRSLYMDEARIVRGSGFHEFQAVMTGIIAEICDFGRASQHPLAAE